MNHSDCQPDRFNFLQNFVTIPVGSDQAVNDDNVTATANDLPRIEEKSGNFIYALIIISYLIRRYLEKSMK